jgi:hypothetical protein
VYPAVELEYLTVFDSAGRCLGEVVDMPDRRLDLFIRLCLQGSGKVSLSKRVRFGELTDEEISRMEGIVREAVSQTSDSAALSEN